MKRMLSLCAAALCLTLTLTPTALAADFEPAVPNAKVCYPTAIVRGDDGGCLLYTSPSPRDTERSRMPSSA